MLDVGILGKEDSTRKAKEIEAEQWLPVEVACSVTSIEGESEELASKVFWKFGEEVPDSAFPNPLEHPFQKVQFEGSGVAKIDKEAKGE